MVSLLSLPSLRSLPSLLQVSGGLGSTKWVTVSVAGDEKFEAV